MNKSYAALLIIGITLFTACGKANQTSVEPISTADVASTGVDEDALTPQSFPSKIIGTDDLIKVKADGSNLDPKLRAKIDAFGLLAIAATAANGGAGSCTATHLGNGYAITAGHCFFNENTPGNQKKVNQPCPEMKIYWGYRGSPATGSPKPIVSLISQCTKVIYAELSGSRDFGIMKLDNVPKVSVGLQNDNKRAPLNTKLTIFGYPQGRPLEWSQYCPLVPTIAKEAHMQVSRFAYQCDTEPGNSGSSVLAISTTGDIRIVGIHDAAAPTNIDYNIATYVFDMRQALRASGINIDQLVGQSFR